MSNDTRNVGRRSLFAFGAAGSTTLTRQFSAMRWGLKASNELIKDEGNNGRLWNREEDYVINRRRASGSIELIPRLNDLRVLLPSLVGGAFSVNNLDAGVISAFFPLGRFDRTAGINTVFLYDRCVCSKAVFSSQDSTDGLLKLAMDIEAVTVARNAAGTWPSISLSTLPPLVHRQSVVTIGGNAYKVKNLTITIENKLATDEFYNSQTRDQIPVQSQLITLEHETPFDLAQDLSVMDLNGVSVAATVVYTSGGLSLTFTFPALVWPGDEPEVGGKDSVVTNRFRWEASTDATGTPADVPMRIVLDDTP